MELKVLYVIGTEREETSSKKKRFNNSQWLRAQESGIRKERDP